MVNLYRHPNKELTDLLISQKWMGGIREDLSFLKMAVDLGWTPMYNTYDLPRSLPQHDIAFERGNIDLWYAPYMKDNAVVQRWLVQEKGSWNQSRKYNSLKEALETEESLTKL